MARREGRARREGWAPSQRQLKVGEQIRHALAWILERGQVRDPGLKGVLLTVTEVRMSPDLRQGKVFVTPLGGGETADVLAGLDRARPFLRREIARSVQLKFVPDFAFEVDDSFDRAERIDRLLRETRPGGGEGAVDRAEDAGEGDGEKEDDGT